MNASDLYGILGINKTADENDIRKQYKRLSLQHHPDKGGSVEEFQKIQKAYEILSDSNKRQMYDMTGSTDDNGNQQNPFQHGGVDLGSMFTSMFGGFNPFEQVPGMPGRQKRNKPPPKTHEIPISIHDFYHGKQIKIQFERQKFCDTCKGEGFITFNSCAQCNGRGILEQMVMVGPGMYATSRGPCDGCRGKGKIGSGSCSPCKGKKVFNQEKFLDIKVDAGMKKGDNLVFPNECSDDPNFMEPGDVHIFFSEADEHNDVKRENNDLVANCYISLSESILGTTYMIKNHPNYINGMEVKIPKGTQNNENVVINGEGMPKRNSKQFGNFLLKVNIIVSKEEKELLVKHEEELQKIFKTTNTIDESIEHEQLY